MKPNGKREESRPAHGNSGVIPTLCVITQRNKGAWNSRITPTQYHKPNALFLVANKVDADGCTGCVLDRLVTADIRRAKDRRLAVVWLIRLNRIERRAA